MGARAAPQAAAVGADAGRGGRKTETWVVLKAGVGAWLGWAGVGARLTEAGVAA